MDNVQVIAASDLEAGSEIHNTYGELGNAELVSKYGFALPDNPFDALELDKQDLVDAARLHMRKSLSERCFRRRMRFLEQQRCAATERFCVAGWASGSSKPDGAGQPFLYQAGWRFILSCVAWRFQARLSTACLVAYHVSEPLQYQRSRGCHRGYCPAIGGTPQHTHNSPFLPFVALQ